MSKYKCPNCRRDWSLEVEKSFWTKLTEEEINDAPEFGYFDDTSTAKCNKCYWYGVVAQTQMLEVK